MPRPTLLPLRWTRAWLSGLLMALLGLPCARAEPATVVYTLDYPPLVVVEDRAASHQGLATRVLRTAAKRAGVNLDIQVVPWVRAQKSTLEGSGELLYPVIRTAAREPLYEWVGPVARIDYQLFRLRSARAVPVPEHIEDFPKHRVGLVRADPVTAMLLAKGLSVKDEATSIAQLIKMLLGDRIDFIAATPEAMAYGLTLLGVDAQTVERVKPLNVLLTDGLAYVVTRRGADSDTIRKLRRSLSDMRRDGSWDRAYDGTLAKGG